MRFIYKFALRLRSLFKRGRVEQELRDELRFHVENLAAEKEVRGLDTEDSRFGALREFGGLDQITEECRDMRRVNFIDSFSKDVRYGARQLLLHPAFTIVAVLTLALGIGANTAIFSVVNGVILQPLPFAHPDRLISLTDAYPQGAVVAMQANLRTLEVAGYSDSQEMNLTGLGEPVRLSGAAVSANFFSLLGVRPELGRVFVPEEDYPGKDNVVILSHSLWREKFGSDPNIVGRSVTIESRSREVVGVMPEGFQYASSKARFWVPLHLDPRNVGNYWGGGFMPVLGRLRNDQTIAQARAELRTNLPRMRGMFPWKMPDALWAEATIIPLQEELVGGVRSKLLLLLGAAGLVLLIACVNVANLLLSRAANRQKEIAVRAALGAGRGRICRQLLTESVILSLLGGVLGVLLAGQGVTWLKATLPPDTPRLASVGIDWRVLAFTAVIAILTGLIFGTAPAIHSLKIDLMESIQSGKQRATVSSHGLRRALAVAEIALAVVLVIGAGLIVKSLWALTHVRPGFRAESVMTARITPSENFCHSLERCRAFYMDLVERARALPGVEVAAAANVLPLSGRINAYSADFEDHPRNPSDPAAVLFETIVTPDYLRAMGIPLLKGRGFTLADMAPASAPVALITASTARKYWPGQDPIGKHLRRVWAQDWTTVVGVVDDVHEYTLASPLPEYMDGAVYAPYGNASRTHNRNGALMPTAMTLVLRTNGGAKNLPDELKKLVAGLNADVPVSEAHTLRQVVTESVAAPRSTMTLFAIFAAMALVLGAVGVYGVMAYFVAQRTPEIGIRLALGAQKKDVLDLVMRQGAQMALAGVALGLAGALGLTRFLSSLLYDVRPTDPLTFLAVSLILAGVALLACYVPARRAARVDPTVALRYE